MKQYNSNGEYVNPVNGLTGLEVTDATGDSYKKMIDIPEISKDEMLEQTKKEFLQENGVANSDTTKRSDVYTNMYWKVSKNDRLSAGYTMEQYIEYKDIIFTSYFAESHKIFAPCGLQGSG